MAYWTRGDSGNVLSWGSGFYANLLAALTPMRCALFVGSDVIDVTGFQTFAAARTEGLKQWRVNISAYAGTTPYIGNAGTLAYSAGGYALHVPKWTWRAQSAAIPNTEFNPSVEWRSFMPDIFQADCSFDAGIDSGTALVLPPAPAAALPTLTLTYKAGATLAASAIVNSMNASIAVRERNMAGYSVSGTGSWTAAGGIFGTRTFGATINADPYWSAGGAAVGAIVIQSSTGRTYSGADSFWTGMTINCEVDKAVRVDLTVQGTGALTLA